MKQKKPNGWIETVWENCHKNCPLNRSTLSPALQPNDMQWCMHKIELNLSSQKFKSNKLITMCVQLVCWKQNKIFILQKLDSMAKKTFNKSITCNRVLVLFAFSLFEFAIAISQINWTTRKKNSHKITQPNKNQFQFRFHCLYLTWPNDMMMVMMMH